MPETDMVFDRNMNPTWCDSPEGIVSWLYYQLDNNPRRVEGCTVRTGWPHEFLTVSEYLGKYIVETVEGTER